MTRLPVSYTRNAVVLPLVLSLFVPVTPYLSRSLLYESHKSVHSSARYESIRVRILYSPPLRHSNTRRPTDRQRTLGLVANYGHLH